MPVDEDLLLVLKSSTLGGGDPALGEELLATFLHETLQIGHLPQRIICTGSAVLLTTKGSPVIDLMKRFVEAGSRIQSCEASLQHHQRTDDLEVGTVGTMHDMVEAMLGYRRVIQL